MIVSAATENANLIPYDRFKAQQQQREYEERKQQDADADADDLDLLSPEDRERFKILSYCAQLYSDARKAREPQPFDLAWDLYIGNTWPTNWPGWRPKITVNKVRAFITFMQAVMTDNKPRVNVEPLVQGSEDAADLLRKLVDRDWDENDMQQKLATFVLYGLIWGTSFMKITYDPYADGGRGRHIATPIAPYKVFVNRTATCIEDAEYIIHVDDTTMGWIRRNFPEKAAACNKVRGIQTGDFHDRDRDFIQDAAVYGRERIVTAQNISGNVTAPMYTHGGSFQEGDWDTVELGEYWLRDESLEEYQRQKYENGKPKFEPVEDEDGMLELETVGQHVAISEIDGQPFLAPIMRAKMQPVMESAWRLKYPNGRLVLIAGGRVLLRDVPAPFQTDGFPWAMWKDYDVGAFWGQGEGIAIKDCQLASNNVLTEVYNILKKVGNPSYMLKKGAGVNAASIKNKPGYIIPMDEMDAIKPLPKPEIPGEFMQLFGALQKAMGEVSGVNEAVTGSLPGANTAFATMDQLQESGAAPIRLKVRNLETGITRIGKLRIQLIQQFDNGERPLRETVDQLAPAVAEDGSAAAPVVQPAKNVEAQFRKYTKADLQGAVEFGVVPISSLSTSPAGTWNRWMSMLDKKLIDRRWWMQKFRVEGWRTQLPRMEKQEAANAAIGAAAKRASKVGGDKKPGPAPTRSDRHPQRRPAPPSQVPSRLSNNAVR